MESEIKLAVAGEKFKEASQVNSNSEEEPGLELFLAQKRKYRENVRNRSLIERLRELEALQEQSYEILRVRAANGGVPIPLGWQRWAEAQNEIGLKK